MTNREFHISVVAASRNDDHGGGLLNRMQQFIDGFVIQCKRHDLNAELIIVEWNPPSDRKPLAEVLHFPKDKGPCSIRIITVSSQLHAKLAHADQLPLFQMIAKNVGIRRAHGRYVLATNIDILFSDETIKFIRTQLKPGKLYRVDRVDVPTETQVNNDFDKTLLFCEKNKFRIHNKYGSFIKVNNHWESSTVKRRKLKLQAALLDYKKELMSLLAIDRWLKKIIRYVLWVCRRIIAKKFYLTLIIRLHKIHFNSINEHIGVRTRRVIAHFKLIVHTMIPSERIMKSLKALKVLLGNYFKRTRNKLLHVTLHTNGCGDFTLLSRKDWFELRGYPEWEIFSWHIDSVLLYQANRNGIKEIDLPKHMPIYHIEHSVGSGYTPEGTEQLFGRIEAKKLRYLDWSSFLQVVKEMDELKSQGKAVCYNNDAWGFATESLTETWV
jgi:hypothetical protein